MKKNIFKMINFSLILVTSIVFIYYSIVISIAGVAGKYISIGSLTSSDFKDLSNIFSKGFIIDYLVYSLCLFTYYVLYLLKKNKGFYLVFVINILLVLVNIYSSGLTYTVFILLVPIINGLLFMYINKLN